MKRFWANYMRILAASLRRMSRAEQEQLVEKAAMLICIGVVVLLVLLFYPVIPRLARVLILPAALLSIWFSGNKIVAPAILRNWKSDLEGEFGAKVCFCAVLVVQFLLVVLLVFLIYGRLSGSL